MIPLLLATVLALQDPKPTTGEWRDLDGIVYVINEDIVTQRGFQKQLAKFLSRNPGADQESARKLLSGEIVRGALGAQAGEAMGLDAALVRRSVRDYERRVIESKGGVDQYSEMLKHENTTAEEMRAEYQKAVLRDMWESSRTGQGPNQLQKIIADRYVRPGTLRLTYTKITRDPAAIGRIGGDSSKVVLQILELDPAKVGGTAELESAAAAARARIASGASDFEGEYGKIGLASGTWRPTDPLDLARLRATDPDLARMLAEAKEGALLPVLAPRGEIKIWRVVRLNQRIAAHAPAFKSAEVQKTIRDMRQDWLDGRRLDAARKLQYDSSYIWPTAPDGH